MTVITAGEIVERWQQRRKAREPEFNTAEKVRQAYNGDIVLPLPELDRDEKAAVANLMRLTVDQTSDRISSTVPNLLVPPLRTGIKKSQDEADMRRRVLAGWWDANGWDAIQGRRARHFTAYASSPVMIRPNFKERRPEWWVLNPLSTFPAPCARYDDMEPDDCIYSTTLTLSYLRKWWPDAIVNLAGADTRNPDTKFTVLTYVDAEQHAMVVVGRDGQYHPETSWMTRVGGERYKMLEWMPNRAEMCTVVMPGRVTLDRPMGQFDGMLPLFVKRARLAALEEIAIEKGVFENEWFVEDANSGGEIVTVADGREGIVGHVRGGRIEWHTQNPGYKTDQALDRLERQERIEGPVPAEYGAESASNVRTDRRGNSILSAATDFGIMAVHRAFRRSYELEFQRAIAIDRACFRGGLEPKSYAVSWKGASGVVEYRPEVLWEKPTQVLVRWSMPGADINGLTVSGGQRVQMGTLSRRGFMEIDPLVDDVEEELDRISAQQIDDLWPVALQNDMAAGLITGLDLARMQELVATNKMERYAAYNLVHQEAQERQAKAAAAQAGSPEAMPSVTQPGEVSAGGTPPVEDRSGLSGLMAQLRGPMRQTPLEQGAAA